MESSLRFDSAQRKLFLHAKEHFVSDDNVVLSVSGRLATDDGAFRGKAKLRRKFFPEINTRVDVGAKYESDIEQLSYGASARKTFELSSDGLLSLDLKAAYAYAPGRKNHVWKSKVELSQKIFNFTEDQDLRLQLGYDLANKQPYGQIRENNWTLNTNFRNTWSISYDL